MNEEYKELMFDWKKLTSGIDLEDCYYIKRNDIVSSTGSNEICTGTSTYNEVDKLKTRLTNLEYANDIMQTNSSAMAEDLAQRENKIKSLETKVAELKAKIEYCKKNGVWAEYTQPSFSVEDKEKLHLLDGLELD